MNEVEYYIFQFKNSQKDILLYLHHLLVNKFNLTPKIRYKIPFYFGNKRICYLNPIKKDKIELAFTNGNKLSDSQGLLISKDRKQIKGIEFSDIKLIPEKDIIEIIQEAVLLDDTIPSRSKNTSY